MSISSKRDLNFAFPADNRRDYDAYQQARSAKLWTRQKNSTFFSRLVDNFKRWSVYRKYRKFCAPKLSTIELMEVLREAFKDHKIKDGEIL